MAILEMKLKNKNKNKNFLFDWLNFNSACKKSRKKTEKKSLDHSIIQSFFILTYMNAAETESTTESFNSSISILYIGF